METIVKDYTWAEYREAIGALPASASCGSSGWAGAPNVGAAIKVADTGWREGADKVRSIAIPAVQTVASALRADAWGWDVTGAAYDVGEYLSGTPECWLSPDAVASKPLVRIAANIVSSAGVPNDALEMRGAAVVALTLALQASGYAVQVYAVEGMNLKGKDVWHRTCLTDDHGGPVDTDRLLFALAHVGNMRQIGYTLGAVLAGGKASDAGYVNWPSTGWGKDSVPPKATGWEHDLYLAPPYLDDANWRDAASVAAWVAEQYARLAAGGDKRP